MAIPRQKKKHRGFLLASESAEFFEGETDPWLIAYLRGL
jgi:hypothetical protein